MTTQITAVQQIDEAIERLKQIREIFAEGGEPVGAFRFCIADNSVINDHLQLFPHTLMSEPPNREKSAACAKAIGVEWVADGCGMWEGKLKGMPTVKIIIHHAEVSVRSTNPVEL